MPLTDAYMSAWQRTPIIKKSGFVTQSVGLIIEGECPGVFINEVCLVKCVNNTLVKAQVVGFKRETVLLMPYEKNRSFSYGSEIIATGSTSTITLNDKLLGSTLDGFGQPIEVKNIYVNESSSSKKLLEPICPLERKEITDYLSTGIRAIDSCLTIGKGQRIGLFSGSGVGKSSLLLDVFNNMHRENVISIAVLIGERGREAHEFIAQVKDQKQNTIVVVATAEQPAIARVQAIYSAITIANYFSTQGKDVLVTIDSITRFAYALREIGLAMGEPATVKGYTPSVFSHLTSVVEQFGAFSKRGSITAIMTVLADGDDLYDPVVDSVRAIIDGHIVLTRELAEKGHFPAIDVTKSVSRLFNQLNSEKQKKAVMAIRKVIANYLENKEVIELGIVDQENDEIKSIKENYRVVESFLQQSLGAPTSYKDTLGQVLDVHGKIS